MPPIDRSTSADVAVLRMARPPVNGLDRALRSELLGALHAAQQDASVRGIVLTGGDRVFSAGADISEFAGGASGAAFAEPWLGAVCTALASSPKPVVAAIEGACLGGGLELALACHGRIAGRTARLALPEIKLGLLPGAGGTQRLPRLIGVEAAVSMILSGDAIDSVRADALGLATAVDGSVLEHETALARRLAAHSGSRADDGAVATARTRELGAAALGDAAARLRRPSRAQAAIIEAVRASFERPLEDGLACERRLFEELLGTAEARALQYAFFGDRAAGRVDALPRDVAVRRVSEVAVVGAGTMGAGIAMCVANAGLAAVLIDSAPEALDRGLQRIEQTYRTAVQKGKLSSGEAEARRAAIRASGSLEAVCTADLVVEAVPEALDLKRSVFAEVDRHAKPGAILASNTSTLDVGAIGASTSRPGDVVGLHFFSPAHVMRLLEVVRTERSSDAAVATAMAFARAIGKVGVLARVCDGFIGNRMFEEYCRQAFFLLDEGALPAQVDHALESWGMAMGPFAVLDLAGGDIAWAIRQRRAREQPDQPYSRLPDLLCELGRFGQKTGAGFYRYDGGTRGRAVDPEVDALVVEHSRRIGVERRTISDDEIVSRCVLALVNEGARLLDERIAQRASDIDVVYRNGYGFPATRGGPMYAADEMGLANVVAKIARYSQGYRGASWRLSTLLESAARLGQRLSAL